MQITARTAAENDVDAIVALVESAIVELTPIRGGSIWSRLDARVEPFDDSVRADLDHQNYLVVVGQIDGATVGYSVVRPVDLHDGARIGRIAEIYVHPEARGVSVGETMMTEIEQWAKNAELIGLDSMALPGDRATKNFFETFGLVARAISVYRPLSD